MRKNIMILGEGNYPFSGGGVSTWCHSICNQLSEFDYSLFTITAQVHSESKYDIAENIIDIVQLPLWCLEDPSEIFNYHELYYDKVLKIEVTKDDSIREHFLPIFDKLMNIIFLNDTDAPFISQVYLDLHAYFTKYDYKSTLYSLEVWEYYKTKITHLSEKEEYMRDISISDIVFSIRWLYRFLLPISIELKECDIYHVTMSGFPIIPAFICKSKFNKPIILTEHGVFIRERYISLGTSTFSFFLKKFLINLSESVTRVAYLNADVIVSVNEYNLKWSQMYGADKKKFKVIYNGVDENVFKPLSTKTTRNVVVAAARIFELKDIITMIRTCAVVKNAISDVQFIVYGSTTTVPAYTLECEMLIKELALEANFILAGHHNKPSELYHEGKVSILTSISEGFPYTIIESMSCGVPVIATDVGGVKEAIDDGYDGFICKPKDYTALAEKVVLLLENDELRNKMSVNARDKVLDKFRQDDILNNYRELYQSLS